MARSSSLVHPTTLKPLAVPAPAVRRRASSLGGAFWGGRAYEAASLDSQDLGGFRPPTYSPDRAIGGSRRTLDARLHDMVRNDGWAAGTVSAFVNTAIGVNLRYSSKPDWRALGLDFEVAVELGKAFETAWRVHCNDPRRYCDARRQVGMGGQFHQEFRHLAIDGDAIALALWREEQRRGGFPYATTFQVMHPARLSNPHDKPDEELLRGGVALDRFGAAVGYHFRRRHPGDRGIAAGLGGVQWDFVARETPWGRPMVIHHFRPDEAEQTRGVSPFAPIVRRLKMLGKYESAEVQAAVANAVLAAYIETSLDPETMSELLDNKEKRDSFNDEREALYDEAPIMLNGFRMPVMPPGDRINFPMAARPNRESGDFANLSLRYVASATGLNPSTISRDYAQTNYSSERAAMLEGWRTISTARDSFANGIATLKLLCVLEEAVETGLVELPPGAPAFWEAPGAYLAGKWIGPPRGWVDPLKEAQASQARQDAYVSTAEDENAEQGRDWEETFEQRRVEQLRREELGLTGPARTAMRETERETANGDRETETVYEREG